MAQQSDGDRQADRDEQRGGDHPAGGERLGDQVAGERGLGGAGHQAVAEREPEHVLDECVPVDEQDRQQREDGQAEGAQGGARRGPAGGGPADQHDRHRPREELQRAGDADREAGAAGPVGGGQREGEQAEREYGEVVTAGGERERGDGQDGGGLDGAQQRGGAAG